MSSNGSLTLQLKQMVYKYPATFYSDAEIENGNEPRTKSFWVGKEILQWPPVIILQDSMMQSVSS